MPDKREALFAVVGRIQSEYDDYSVWFNTSGVIHSVTTLVAAVYEHWDMGEAFLNEGWGWEGDGSGLFDGLAELRSDFVQAPTASLERASIDRALRLLYRLEALVAGCGNFLGDVTFEEECPDSRSATMEWVCRLAGSGERCKSPTSVSWYSSDPFVAALGAFALLLDHHLSKGGELNNRAFQMATGGELVNTVENLID